MRQKRDDQKAVEKAVHQIKRRTRRNFSRKRKSALYYRDFEERTASRSCAAARDFHVRSSDLEHSTHQVYAAHSSLGLLHCSLASPLDAFSRCYREGSESFAVPWGR